MPDQLNSDILCDVVVVGSGAGGLSTAITARKLGLDVIVVEKEPFFGGTTAFSGGVLWIPGNAHGEGLGGKDSRDAALRYIKDQVGNHFDAAAVDAFLDNGPAMLRFFEAETEVKFVATRYPDYHPGAPGGVDIGRSVLAAPYNAKGLGKELSRLRPPLSTITFLGMMFNSSNADIKHFFNATKSFTSFVYVARRLVAHFAELVQFGRGVSLTSGNALAARLAKTAFDLGIPIHTSSPVKALIRDGERIAGVLVEDKGRPRQIRARRGVVLAAGGFPHDRARIAKLYPHLQRGGQHFSPVPAGNTGDGIALAEGVGAGPLTEFPNAAAWIPVSIVLHRGGATPFPHLLDRYKPGVIAVTTNGQRFTNESNSYHDVGEAIVEAGRSQAESAAWLICDDPTIRKYGLGFAKPAPLPLGPHLRNGYLHKGASLEALAKAIGVDPQGLSETVRDFNLAAKEGIDRQFHRGETAFNRYLGDPDHTPNPNVGPIEKGPFYAVKLHMGDLGTFDGLKTTVDGKVLDHGGAPIAGLYAVGNDRASLFGGNYPGAGITLGPNMTFGYITGKALAADQI